MFLSSLSFLKIAFMDKGVIPGLVLSPFIVNVLPVEVCPYAKIETLIPFKKDSIFSLKAILKISSVLLSWSNILSEK